MTISVKQNNTYAAATGVWVKVNGVWKQVATSGLEGLTGWATIKSVTGSPKRYAYNDGSMDWVAFEWTNTTDPSPNSFTTQAGGLVDALIVGGGEMGTWNDSPRRYGNAGRVIDGLQQVSTAASIVVGPAGGAGWSSLGSITVGPAGIGEHDSGIGGGSTPSQKYAPLSSSITGQPETYAGAFSFYGEGKSTTTFGDGALSHSSTDHRPGVVIVRVPAAQAAGVSAGSWVTRIDYYAEVTDGIVTDTYQERFYGDDSVRTENGRYASPEQPDDLIPCDPSVAEGWTYADGEFTPPPPDPSWREQAIEALKQQLKDLQKDT